VNVDPRSIVREGYNAAASEYARWLDEEVVSLARPRYLDLFCGELSEGAEVLELGCGGGGPSSARLAERFSLTGVDISAGQIALARSRLPEVAFVEADMTRYERVPSSIDGVVALYSFIHLPEGELPSMLGRIAGWLRPNGLLLACFGARGAGTHFESEWLGGASMYWSGYAVEDTRGFILDAGLEVVITSVEVDLEGGEPAPFL
jgi:SAM-dependent methyltransferase